MKKIIEQIKKKLHSKEYDFLRENKQLGSHIILLTLGGSYAYGTNQETSDIDLRGVYLNSKEELLGIFEPSEQFTEIQTDTVIYSFQKIIKLLLNCNPNTIELLGSKQEHYLYLSSIGKELLEHRHLFLSKKCINSFGGYANSQLRRLSNKSARLVSQSERERHILKTIEHVSYDFKEHYVNPEDGIRLYIDQSDREEFDTEIFMDINLTHYPLRDYKGMWSEMANIVREYGKLGKRNEKAIEHDKLGKHMMHLVRLYFMCIDILEREEIITYRANEHDFLMKIRQGAYLDKNRQPTKEFFELIDELEKKLDYAIKHTNLPELPDYNKINKFVQSINERVVKEEWNFQKK